MTFLNTIIESEERAKKSLDEARSAAQKKVVDAEAKLKKTLEAHTQTLEKKRAEALQDQKKELKALLVSKVKEGTVEAEAIQGAVASRKKVAINLVLNSFKAK